VSRQVHHDARFAAFEPSQVKADERVAGVGVFEIPQRLQRAGVAARHLLVRVFVGVGPVHGWC
jgi:hypothetical protein